MRDCVVCGYPVHPTCDADAPCGAIVHEDCYHEHLEECFECRDALNEELNDN